MTALPPAVPAPETGPDAGAVWHYGDPLGEQRAAARAAVLVDRSHRAVLTLTGKERQTWLHSISSQHVSALPDGAVTENLSLDLQGRVEDHWIQTELGGTTYLDTEPWRGEPLLTYLRKMVFWADVQIEPADLAVLSLLGPGLADEQVIKALGVEALPQEATAVALPGGGFLRRLPASGIELDLVVPRESIGEYTGRLIAAGVQPAGVWAYEAHRVAAGRPRLGVDTDERTIPHEVGWIGGPGVGAVHLDKGCYRGQETVARVHNLGKPPRMLVILQLDGSADRPATGDTVTAGGRNVGRIGTVVEHADEGPIALALLKRGLPVDTALIAGEQAQAPAVIDPDSMPAADATAGAGRAAVERLRGR
ncbi:glycine cleavage system protein T [Mycolicibacterium conceptionense]|uniref:Glycine cleavage system protein T n=1 Tax=Mycolicibacterium conceptionense TaxID=451644 RepID=A0A1A3MGH4_9MYCO|nr:MULTISPECIES: folate-binding protein YgfZ [Mycolicibacterium]MCW1822288.1 folate-binding protein YgfZ [Mycolicibacterium senegalense]OBB05477.1 glycine cleavage system protein T [Mycolicibacterium conceptionense]OBE96090.1 glycine cleavage system protein T [Mycolicibacterium conceptionense]OBF19625.1 glycine cleavage system protein T [Mycolicibacterium conceptionense]OBF48139.1 glycine cleavage system protein T [Mycolicibacterium conceptionense]